MPIFETVNASDALMHLLSGVSVINQEVIHYSQFKKRIFIWAANCKGHARNYIYYTMKGCKTVFINIIISNCTRIGACKVYNYYFEKLNCSNYSRLVNFQ